jgi:hypothetical protein
VVAEPCDEEAMSIVPRTFLFIRVQLAASRRAVLLSAAAVLILTGVGARTETEGSQAPLQHSPECPKEAPLEPGRDARDRAIAAVRQSLRTGPQEWRTYEIRSAYPAAKDEGFGIVVFGMCGPVVGSKTWIVEVRFPELEPSASLSQGQAFVSRFQSGWRVWYRYH